MTMEEAVDTRSNPYALAGWLSFLHAGILLAKSGVELLTKIMTLTISNYFQLIIGFHAVGVLLGIYVLFMFRRFLNEQHDFHKADALIIILIICNIAAMLVDIVSLVLNSYYSFITANMIVYVLVNIISIIYAIRLLKMDNDLSGLLKPYVYATIAGGVCGATLILSHIAGLIYVVSLILLGIIMIRARSEFEYL